MHDVFYCVRACKSYLRFSFRIFFLGVAGRLILACVSRPVFQYQPFLPHGIVSVSASGDCGLDEKEQHKSVSQKSAASNILALKRTNTSFNEETEHFRETL